MNKTVKAAILAALASIAAAIGALIIYVQNQPETTIPTPVAGSVAPAPAGKAAPAPAGSSSPSNPGTPSKTGFSVGIQTWFIDQAGSWTGEKLWNSSPNFAKYPANDPWNPAFLAEMGRFSTIRHMDSAAVNCSKVDKWSKRRLPTNATQEAYGARDGSGSDGIALEYRIDMCNRANTDCWFTHPLLADDDYMRQHAQMVKDKLGANHKVYIELSNEVWNGGFCAFQEAIDKGKAGGFDSNEYYAGIAWELFRARQMFKIYESVFGASAMGSRVIRVFAESGNLDLTTQAFKNSKAAVAGQKVDFLALAPYIGNGTNGSSETLERWKSEVDRKVSGEPIATAKSQASANGIPQIGCYEAGMHHLQNAQVFAASSVSGQAYTYMLDKFAANMTGVCNLYTHASEWKTGGAWGLKTSTGQQDSAAPKWQATMNWISAH